MVSGTSAQAWQDAAAGQSDEPPVFGQFIRQIEGVWPAAVAVGQDGRIYVLDDLQRKVRIFEQDGTEFLGQLPDGERVKAPGDEVRELDVALPQTDRELLPPKPVAVVVDADNRMYVVDGDNHRVVCLTDAGEQRWSIGGFGTFPGQFADPTAIALVPNSNTLLVADGQNHRVQAFNTDGEFLYEWGKHAMVPREGEGKIHYPNDIAVSPDGNFVVVAEMFERRIQIFGPRPRNGAATDGDAVAKPPPTVQSHFGSIMAVDGRLAAVWEPELRRVLVFDMGHTVPIHITTFGEYGTKLGQFTSIAGMAIDEAKRTIYILDNGTRRIDVVKLRFDPEAPTKYDPTMARFVRTIPLHEIAKQATYSLEAMTATPEGDLVIVDRQRKRLWSWHHSTGQLNAWQFEGLEEESSQMTAIAIDNDGHRVVIVDCGSRHVLVYKTGHRLWKTLVDGGEGETLMMPVAACVGDDGAVYVVDAGADAIVKYNTEGEFVKKWGSTGTGDGELWMPSAVGIDSQNRIVVLDFGNHRGQLFTTEGEWLASFSAGRARTRQLQPAPREPKPD